MNSFDARNCPTDQTSREALASRGLDYRVMVGEERADFRKAVMRGFLDGEPTAAALAELDGQPDSRSIGVFDASAVQPLPVATVKSWVTPLTVPGGELPMWAISAVTVAATHRRRGIARAMLEGELRAAKAEGLAMAGLTVTEATIYGRYGFASAAPVATVKISAKLAGWRAPEPAARILFVDREQLASDLGELHERTRADRIGDIAGWNRRWQQHAGLDAGAENPEKIRGVRAVDAAGETVGSMAYRLVEGADYRRHTLSVRHLVAATPDARAALWKFAIEHDLVETIEAYNQPIDDPLPWQVNDANMVEQRVSEHGWLRILDVPAALEARRFEGGFGVRIAVTDPLGIADGSWTVAQLGADGVRVEPLADGAEADVTIDVGALSAAYLGAVRLETLQAAGRVTGSADKIRALSDALRARAFPHLSIVY
ncbi:GNAT family N-acetyltransferase [Microbacterium gubbeenense]|uniref:GNAT family N-acetyltransferase n=1 Tax=Microbacterium gubbeenense TaxID=159896 RepID=UPI003F9B11DE